MKGHGGVGNGREEGWEGEMRVMGMDRGRKRKGERGEGKGREVSGPSLPVPVELVSGDVFIDPPECVDAPEC